MEKTGMNVGIVGLGVVGIATAHRLHELGNEIYASDIRNPNEIQDWKEEFHFIKPYTLKDTDATFMALPTPSTEEQLYACLLPEKRLQVSEGRFHESLDTKLYKDLAGPLGLELKAKEDYHVFVVRSTVHPGMTRKFGQSLEQASGKKLGYDFGIAMIPEFLRAFNNKQDEVDAKLLVAGVYDETTKDVIEKIYQNLPLNQDGSQKLYPMTLEEAEFIKLESNSLNAIWISLMNSRLENYELIEEKTGIHMDYERMTNVLVNMTESFYSATYGTTAGIPYGGTCLKKDPTALLSWLEDSNRVNSHFSRYLETSVHVNRHLSNRILNHHKFPATLKEGIPKRLMGRDHDTYDNIRKVKQALSEGGTYFGEKA